MKKSSIDDGKKITFYFTLVTLIATLTKAYIWYIPIYLLFMIYLLFKDNTLREIIKSFKIKKSGGEGELEVQRVLSTLGYSKYVVLNNLNLKHEGKEAQIDHIVISDNAIFNIETKNYQGSITIDYEGNITQKTKYGKGDITKVLSQSKDHRGIISSILNGEVTIYDLVIIANKKTKIIKLSSIDINILSISELKEFITEKSNKEKCINKEAVCYILENNKVEGFRLIKKNAKYFFKNNGRLLKYIGACVICLSVLFSLYDGNILKIFGINSNSTNVSNMLTGKSLELKELNKSIKFNNFEERDIGVYMTLHNQDDINFSNMRFTLLDIKGESFIGIQYGENNLNEVKYLFQGVKSLKGLYKLKVSYIGEDGFQKTSEFNFKEIN